MEELAVLEYESNSLASHPNDFTYSDGAFHAHRLFSGPFMGRLAGVELMTGSVIIEPCMIKIGILASMYRRVPSQVANVCPRRLPKSKQRKSVYRSAESMIRYQQEEGHILKSPHLTSPRCPKPSSSSTGKRSSWVAFNCASAFCTVRLLGTDRRQ